eukprot:TRINITY_DN7294_c0_g1_i1.p1 TRINITY_DN7294_c0_g1~~TRINITY_DN7294_c0_g1_i1.p1  ORF type:complete len:101 (-),score=2.52 TRINITY_DN7294_c0_g1_i1:122-388(-)
MYDAKFDWTSKIPEDICAVSKAKSPRRLSIRLRLKPHKPKSDSDSDEEVKKPEKHSPPKIKKAISTFIRKVKKKDKDKAVPPDETVEE